MGTGKINIWIKEPDGCAVAEMDGYAWARSCCYQECQRIYKAELKNGHAEIEVPSGCYVVDASWKPGCCGEAKETMVIVHCGEMICVNLIREWAGEPLRRITAFVNHAIEAKISKEKINEMVDALKKIAEIVPESKRRYYTENELNLKREVSDETHRKVLAQYESIMKK